MSNVYVIQIPKRGGYFLDISSSEEFGNILKPCFNDNIDISKNTQEIVNSMNEYFKEITEDDFILQAGEHTLFAAACITASYFSDKINILKWDREIRNGRRGGGKYVPVKIESY